MNGTTKEGREWFFHPSPSEVRATLAANIRRARKRVGISQRELAKRARVTVGTIQRIESRRYHAALAVFARIRKVLRVSWIELLRGI